MYPAHESCDVLNNNSGEAQQAAQNLSQVHLLQAEEISGEEDGQELGCGIYNSSGRTGSVSNSNVVEGVLSDGLEEGLSQDDLTLALLGKKDLLLKKTSDGDDQEAGQDKAQTGEEELIAGIYGFDLEHLHADFNSGEGRAPEGAGNHGTEEDHKGSLQEI